MLIIFMTSMDPQGHLEVLGTNPLSNLMKKTDIVFILQTMMLTCNRREEISEVASSHEAHLQYFLLNKGKQTLGQILVAIPASLGSLGT